MENKPESPKRVSPISKESSFVIYGNNGSTLIEQVLLELGWKKSADKNSDNFKLKWVENKSSVNYDTLKDGEQLVNRIPNCFLLTNKLGLLTSLQRYERVWTMLNLGRIIKLRTSEFIPETYRLDDNTERRIFLEIFKPNDIWICKPTGLNQGRGIFLVRNLEEFRKSVTEREELEKKQQRPAMERVIQRYVTNPLLLDGKKFDIRVFMLVASTAPFLILFHKGYARLCLQMYNNQAEDLTAHLTNQFVQRRDATYEYFKEETVWSIEKLNTYINKKVAPQKGLETDWVLNTLTNRIKQIMLYCFHAVKHKLKSRVGYFDLYGLDFLVDDNMKVWLIEINANPCLSTNCDTLKEVIPSVVRETLYLSIECFEKSRRGFPLYPLQTLKNFQILFNGSHSSAYIHPNYPSLKRSWSLVSPGQRSHPSSRDDQDKEEDKMVSRNYMTSIIFESPDEHHNYSSVPVSMFDLNTLESRKPIVDLNTFESRKPLVDLNTLESRKPLVDLKTLESRKTLVDLKTLESRKTLVDLKTLESRKTLVDLNTLESRKPLVDSITNSLPSSPQKSLTSLTQNTKSRDLSPVKSKQREPDKETEDFSRKHELHRGQATPISPVMDGSSPKAQATSEKLSKDQKPDKSRTDGLILEKSGKDQMLLENNFSKEKTTIEKYDKDRPTSEQSNNDLGMSLKDQVTYASATNQITSAEKSVKKQTGKDLWAANRPKGLIISDRFSRGPASREKASASTAQQTDDQDALERQLSRSLYDLSGLRYLGSKSKANGEDSPPVMPAKLKSDDLSPRFLNNPASAKQAKQPTAGPPLKPQNQTVGYARAKSDDAASTSATLARNGPNINSFMKPIQFLSSNQSYQEKKSGPLDSIVEQLEKDLAKAKVLQAVSRTNREYRLVNTDIFGNSISDNNIMRNYQYPMTNQDYAYSQSKSSLEGNRAVDRAVSNRFQYLDRSKTLSSKIYPPASTSFYSAQENNKSYLSPAVLSAYSFTNAKNRTFPPSSEYDGYSSTEGRYVRANQIKERKSASSSDYTDGSRFSAATRRDKPPEKYSEIIIDKKSWELKGQMLYKEATKNVLKEMMHSPTDRAENVYNTGVWNQPVLGLSGTMLQDARRSPSASRLMKGYTSHGAWNGPVRVFPDPDIWLAGLHKTTPGNNQASFNRQQNNMDKDWGHFTVVSPKQDT